MGELHLEIIVDRLLREFKVEANVGAPQVAYRETIRKEANQDTEYAGQSGGKGQYGHVKIKIEPNEAGKGYGSSTLLLAARIPKEYIPAIDNGIQGAMKSGVLARYPAVDVKVTRGVVLSRGRLLCNGLLHRWFDGLQGGYAQG